MKPIVIFKHQHGATAQWHDTSSNHMVIATYSRSPEGTYAQTNVAGPWSGTETLDADTIVPVVLPGYDSERSLALSNADLLLRCLSSGYNTKGALEVVFKGPVLGFDRA